MVKLVCIDVDGTLVGTSGIVSPHVWAAAERLRVRGVRLAICSGRPAFGHTADWARRLDPEGWHIFQTGASVLHLASGASRSVPLDDDVVATLVARARAADASDVVLELYGDSTYVVERDHERARRHAELLGVPFGLAPFEALAGRGVPVVRAQWMLPHADLPRVLADPHPGLTVTPSLSPQMPDTTFVTLTPAGVDKALGRI